MEASDKQYNAYMNFLLCWVPIFECLEALKGTTMYQRDIKKAGNDLEKALDKKMITERYACMHGSDDKAVVYMRDGLHDFFQRIAVMAPEDWQILHECARQIEQNKEWVLDRLGIVSGESADMEEMRERDNLIQAIKNAPIGAVRYARQHFESATKLFLTNTYPK